MTGIHDRITYFAKERKLTIRPTVITILRSAIGLIRRRADCHGKRGKPEDLSREEKKNAAAMLF